jgi:hypothetical protein
MENSNGRTEESTTVNGSRGSSMVSECIETHKERTEEENGRMAKELAG